MYIDLNSRPLTVVLQVSLSYCVLGSLGIVNPTFGSQTVSGMTISVESLCWNQESRAEKVGQRRRYFGTFFENTEPGGSVMHSTSFNM